MAFEYGKVNKNQVASENPVEGNVEFRVKTGTSQLRVLPPHPSSNVWFHKSMEHWVDGVGHVPCARQFGLPCPICEEGERLYASGNELQVKSALDLRPREQYYYNVVVFTSGDGKASPSDGVRILRTGVKVFKVLRNLDNDEAGGWGDMTNPDTGFNVRISRSGTTRTDTDYSVTPVPNKDQTLKDMLTSYNVDLDSLSLHDLSAYAKGLSLPYDELKVKFENKPIAPGFPGGPRLAAPQPVGFVEPPVTAVVSTEGDVVAPPVIEEE